MWCLWVYWGRRHGVLMSDPALIQWDKLYKLGLSPVVTWDTPHYRLHLRVSSLLLTNTSAVRMIRQARVLAEVPLSGIATRHAKTSTERKVHMSCCCYSLSTIRVRSHSLCRAYTSHRCSNRLAVGQRPTRPRDRLRETPSGARSLLWV